MSKAMGGGKLERNLDLATNGLIVVFSHTILQEAAITSKTPRFLFKYKDKYKYRYKDKYKYKDKC